MLIALADIAKSIMQARLSASRTPDWNRCTCAWPKQGWPCHPSASPRFSRVSPGTDRLSGRVGRQRPDPDADAWATSAASRPARQSGTSNGRRPGGLCRLQPLYADLLGSYCRRRTDHSHSIVLCDGNTLNFQRKFFLRVPKNRLRDPSESCALDFKQEYRRSVICSVSATIGISCSIFGLRSDRTVVNASPKRPSAATSRSSTEYHTHQFAGCLRALPPHHA